MSDYDTEANLDFLDTSERADDGVTGDGVTGDGGEHWTPDRARMLGSLIEKGLTTPQNYPLSLNALMMACSQTTNRDPIMDLSESLVQQLLNEAKVDGWVRFVHPRSGRGVTKYRQVVDEVLVLETAQLALLGVLLLRGPQTASELRTRTERMAPMADNAAVEAALESLAERESGPLVRLLDREAGHREQRWIQLVCPPQGEDRVGQAPTGSPRRAALASGVGDELRAEVDELRTELASTQAELTELRRTFETFRAEFG